MVEDRYALAVLAGTPICRSTGTTGESPVLREKQKSAGFGEQNFPAIRITYRSPCDSSRGLPPFDRRRLFDKWKEVIRYGSGTAAVWFGMVSYGAVWSGQECNSWPALQFGRNDVP
jgi:hypothetical protein